MLESKNTIFCSECDCEISEKANELLAGMCWDCHCEFLPDDTKTREAFLANETEQGAAAIAEVFVEPTVLEKVQSIREAIPALEQFIYGIERMLEQTTDLEDYEQHELLSMVNKRAEKFRNLVWDMYYTKK